MAINIILSSVSASTQPCLTLLLTENAIEQWSSNILASGITFVESNFFMDWGGRAHNLDPLHTQFTVGLRSYENLMPDSLRWS